MDLPWADMLEDGKLSDFYVVDRETAFSQSFIRLGILEATIRSLHLQRRPELASDRSEDHLEVVMWHQCRRRESSPCTTYLWPVSSIYVGQYHRNAQWKGVD